MNKVRKENSDSYTLKYASCPWLSSTVIHTLLKKLKKSQVLTPSLNILIKILKKRRITPRELARCFTIWLCVVDRLGGRGHEVSFREECSNSSLLSVSS